MIDVYDTYARMPDNSLIHFDVLVKPEVSQEKVLGFAKEYLKSIGKNIDDISFDKCRFCHSESGNPKVHTAIDTQGYYILPLEGCPKE